MNPYIDGESQSDDSSKVKFWAIRVIDGEPIHASKATKEDGPFYCPKSHEDLVVRKCVEKVSHFAYKTRLSPTGSKESSLHFDCKTEICEALQKAFPEGDWQVERSLLADSEKDFAALRPDISGRFGEAQLPVVIEVQASFLSIKKIIARTTEHTKRNAAILWILPL
jgi:competence protein CoiA